MMKAAQIIFLLSPPAIETYFRPGAARLIVIHSHPWETLTPEKKPRFSTS